MFRFKHLTNTSQGFITSSKLISFFLEGHAQQQIVEKHFFLTVQIKTSANTSFKLKWFKFKSNIY